MANVNQRIIDEYNQAQTLDALQRARRQMGAEIAAQDPAYFQPNIADAGQPMYSLDQRINDIYTGSNILASDNRVTGKVARTLNDMGVPLAAIEPAMGLLQFTPVGTAEGLYDSYTAAPEVVRNIREGEYGRAAGNAATVGLGLLDAGMSALPIAKPVVNAARGVNTRGLTSDALYAGRSLLEGDLGGVRDAFTPSRPAVGLSADAPIENPMIVQHNTTEAGLDVYDRLGGAPMPSIAVSRVSDPLTQYGDISLLLSPEQIAPSRRMTVWPSDAYTGRQPKADFQLSDMNAVADAMSSDPNLRNFSDIRYWTQALDNDWRDMNETMKTVQYGIQNNVSNPQDFNSIFDYANDVRRKLGYDTTPVDEMIGMRAYGDPEMKLYPRDPYTPSGNRRRPLDYNLENVMKRMKQDRAFEAASEQGGHLGGGFVRAAVADPFKSIADIQARRGLLVPEDAMSDVKATWNSTVENTIEDLADKYFDGSWTRASEYFQDLAAGNSTSWANPPQGTREAAMDALRSLRAEAANMPTNYFEAKPKDALNISDFQGAIVPESASQAIEILNRNNVQNILTYGSPEERVALFRQYPQLMFSAAGGVGILGGMLSQQQEGQM